MRAYIAHAQGSPCPTLVLPSPIGWPGDEETLSWILTGVHRALCERGAAHVLKIALVAPPADPGCDLAYRFVQVVPGAVPRFEFGGSCGHSILSSVLAVSQMGMVPRLRPGVRVRVRVLTNDDTVVCEPLDTTPAGDRVTFTVGFRRTAPTPLTGTLLLGETVSVLRTGGQEIPYSLVSLGNPYVFVDATELDIPDEAALFAAGAPLFRALTRIRELVALRLGWDSLCFPKVAALLPGGAGVLAARAVSVPSWHPTLALTGATCLATAAVQVGTVPHRLAGVDASGRLTVRTAAGRTEVRAATAAGRLVEVSVSPKSARLVTALDLPEAGARSRAVPEPSKP
ncbi:hypothetical protein PS467_08260 [Streptomyces luomodiensis]|uniref:Uncharacterized protein n=1 Tax=Streptomyces luomodiensis TaxID=3026192 RepID=A0ABY9US14_9ACTN|nr:hypothetical protein [Streptomyces sp. SCA4-21]WNE95345.1 hypothetical protein PS467_08260 [Streptomyces sp. SCA4-21]